MKSKFYWLIPCFLSFGISALAKVVVLDVRTPEEYSQGHVQDAINLDVRNSNFKIEVLKLDRNDEYKVYCAAGKRATQAVTIMQELGFKHLENLGGFENAKKALKK